MRGRYETHVAAFPLGGVACGTTSEQSIRSLGLCPTTASLAIADWKLDIMSCWLLTMLCHSQAVRYGRKNVVNTDNSKSKESEQTWSRERAKSDCSRISFDSGIGESTSAPSVLFTPKGTPTPLRRTSRKTCVSNVKGVVSKGTAWWPGTSVSERAIV